MIDKNAILITSTGRTGTEFFARLFAEVLPDCTSLHEPDIYKYAGVGNKLEHFLEQIRRAGPWRMVLLKALGNWTLAQVSDERFGGRLNSQQAARKLLAQRHSFISEMPGSTYVESNLGYYGLIDLLPQVFKNHRAIYLIRDGRDWIRSTYNWGEVYGKKGPRTLLAHKWPTAKELRDDELAAEWDRLSRFDQLCWTWARLNEFALNCAEKNPCARVFHFEGIFAEKQRYANLDELITFATSMPGYEKVSIGSTQGWLERKIHESAHEFPSWNDWTPTQKRRFKAICGPLMERLQYPVY